MGGLILRDVQAVGDRYFEAQFVNQDDGDGPPLRCVLFRGSFCAWSGGLYDAAGARLVLSANMQTGPDSLLFAGATPQGVIAWVEVWGGTVYAPRGEPQTAIASVGRVPDPLDAPWHPITLGALIDLLGGEDPKDEVRYDFGGFIPRALASYRGFYEQLALSYDDRWREPMTVAALLVELRGAVGRDYGGWKGGEYTMGRDTPVWAANSGEAPGTGIVGVRRSTYVILETVYIE